MNAEPSGGQFYDDVVTARYLEHRYSDTSSPNVVMEEPAVLAHLGDLADLRVLDLGCGDGAFAEIVLGRGARSYVGIDGSQAMINAARSRERSPEATFELGNIEVLQQAPGSADLVTARMALHYVRDLPATLRAVARTLTPHGRFIFTVTHPVITSHDNDITGLRTNWTVDHYFEAGERHRSWFGCEVTWFHRTIEQYVAAVLGAGFSVEAISECEPDEQQLKAAPEELARRRRVPLMLLISARLR